MTLEQLAPGSRFEAVEAPAIRGTLLKVNEGSATVELEGRARLRDFETADHEWVRIHDSGNRRTTITKALEVRPIK